MVQFCVSETVLLLFCCMFSAVAFAADNGAPPDKTTGQVVQSVTPPPDYTNPDTYMKLVEFSKGWAVTNGPHVVVALAIFVIGRWLAKWITAIVRRGFNKANVEKTLQRFLCKILYYALMAGVIIAAAGELGIQTTSFLAIVGAAGLAIGLALKDSLSNFASGIMLILFRPFQVGDAVTAGGVTGKVFQVDIFSTVIHTPDNQRQIIPNATITSNVITNINAEDIRRIDLTIGIGYGDDIKLAKTTLENIIAADKRILTDPAPVIGVSDLAESSVNLIVRPWVKTTEYWAVRLHLTESIKLTFDKEGISFPYPQQDVHMYQPTD